MNRRTNVILIPAKKKIDPASKADNLTRVAAYCRVSTEQESQQNSYEAQIGYYTDYITSNPEWQLVGIYADEGISGTGTKNRTQFNKMIRAARQKKIDLILCKSISRFARNTVDCLDYVRELRSLGVTVIFEKENINTDSMSSEFIISLYASFAQAESESISKNITWGIEKSFREGNIQYRFHQTLGYRLGPDGKPYIVEEEAEVVRFIFRSFISGCTINEIADILTESGTKRRNGNSKWTRNNVIQILKNEKYVGDAILQKSYTVDCITHERKKNNGQKPMYLIRNCHEPIIDRKTYDLVRLELEKSKRDLSNGKRENNYRTKYSLSKLLVCPYCGGFYKRTTWVLRGKKEGVWRCKNRMEGASCKKSVSYHEDVLQAAVINAVNSIVDKIKDADNYSEENSSRIKGALYEIESLVDQLNDKLVNIEKERERLLEMSGDVDYEHLSAELRELNLKESKMVNKLEELKQRYNKHHRELLKEEAAKKLISELKPMTRFRDSLIYSIVSKIEAVDKNEIRVYFYGGITVTQKIG